MFPVWEVFFVVVVVIPLLVISFSFLNTTKWFWPRLDLDAIKGRLVVVLLLLFFFFLMRGASNRIFLKDIRNTSHKKKKKIYPKSVNCFFLILSKRVLNSYVIYTLLYDTRCWTISLQMKERLRATEMYFYKHMMRIQCVEHVSNKNIRKINEKIYCIEQW